MKLEDVRQIHEISSGHMDTETSTASLNAYLACGWVLLAVQQRGGSTVPWQTVYILGHQDVTAQHSPLDQTAVEDGKQRIFHPRGAFLWG